MHASIAFTRHPKHNKARSYARKDSRHSELKMYTIRTRRIFWGGKADNCSFLIDFIASKGEMSQQSHLRLELPAYVLHAITVECADLIKEGSAGPKHILADENSGWAFNLTEEEYDGYNLE